VEYSRPVMLQVFVPLAAPFPELFPINGDVVIVQLK